MCSLRCSLTNASLLVLIAATQPVLAQGNGKGQQAVKYGAGGVNPQQMQQSIQRINQQLQQGGKELKVAGEKANEASAEWQKVELEHKKNGREISQAKKMAEAEAKSDPQLKAARAKTDELRQRLADIRKTVAARLAKDNEEYQTAMKAHFEALEEQKANSKSEPEIRKALSQNVNEMGRKMQLIEEVAMVDNSDAKRVNAELKQALAEMAVIVRKNNEAIETDQRLSSAKVAFQRTRDELKAATAKRDQAVVAANRIQSVMQAMIRERSGYEAQQQLMQRSQAAQQGQNGNKNRGGKR